MPRPKAARAMFVRNDTAAWLLPIFFLAHRKFGFLENGGMM